MSRLLFLSRWLPYPANNGSKLRILNLLRGLSQEYEISLLSFADHPEDTSGARELQVFCRDVRIVQRKAYDPTSRRAGWGFLSLTPRSLVDTFSSEMELHISQALAQEKYDVVVASQVDMAAYAFCLGHLPAIFEEVELGVLYEQFTRATSLNRRFRHGLTWLKFRYFLARLVRNFRACTVVSGREKELLERTVPHYRAIETVPNGIALTDYSHVRERREPHRMIFTGSFTYGANYEAMDWFLRDVYPSVLAKVPTASVFITGDHANLPLPQTDNVTLTGYVEDIRPLVAASSISLAPLRTGGGTRLKILEAMALRTPVVATSKGAEGLSVRENEHLLVADSPQEFAEAVVRVLRDRTLGRQLAANAYQFVERQYDWANIMPLFVGLVGRVARS